MIIMMMNEAYGTCSHGTNFIFYNNGNNDESDDDNDDNGMVPDISRSRRRGMTTTLIRNGPRPNVIHDNDHNNDDK